MKMNSILKAQNDISINVFGLSKNDGQFSVFPYQATKQKRKRHIPLVENNYDDDGYDETPY